MFDLSEAAEAAISPELVVVANEGVKRIKSRLTNRIFVSVIPGVMIKSLTKAFFQGHIRRSLMLIEGGHEAYRSGRGLVVYLCVRSIIENVACVFDYCDLLTDHLIDDDFEKTAQFIYARVYAASMDGLASDIDGLNNKAVRIGKQIDRISKHFPDLKEHYDHLSEYAHPNATGSLLHFSETLESTDGHAFYFRASPDRDHALRMLITAGRLLALMDDGMSVLERKLTKLEANGRLS